MCGRFTLTVDIQIIKEIFQLSTYDFDYVPRYNIAPGQNILAITEVSGKRSLSYMKWGLVPHWAKDLKIGYKMINARAETIDRKPAFRDPFHYRRCIIPADSYYEWKEIGGAKQPMRIILPGSPVFGFAGIWEYWNPPDGGAVYSCSIITTGPNDSMRKIHDRMPAILNTKQKYEAWLTADNITVLKELLTSYTGEMVVYPVSKMVNSAKLDHPGLIEKVELSPTY